MNPSVAIASQRLEASRSSLRAAIASFDSRADTTSTQAAAPRFADWLQAARGLPGAGPLIETLLGWWARSPWRLAAGLAGEAARLSLGPLARRHPLALIAGAMLLGGVFAWSKPWRWLFRPSLLAGLLPILLESAVSMLPVRSWSDLLVSLFGRREPPAPPDVH